jgi:hypothetical protein
MIVKQKMRTKVVKMIEELSFFNYKAVIVDI